MSQRNRFISPLLRLCALTSKHWHLYPSFRENLRVLLLRAAATRRGRQLWSCQLRRITLRTPPLSFFIRRATSDVLVHNEIFEEGGYQLVQKWDLGNRPCILDLGGNIGLATLYFASCFPTARFIVLEPDKANLQILNLNCQSLREANRVTVVGAFAAAQDGVAGINREGDSWEYKKAALSQPQAESIECLSIPSLRRKMQMERIDLLKCDIEGGEAELFGSCREWIGSVRFLIVETHAPYSLPSLYRDLEQAGWKFKIWQESAGPVISYCFLEQKAQATF